MGRKKQEPLLQEKTKRASDPCHAERMQGSGPKKSSGKKRPTRKTKPWGRNSAFSKRDTAGGRGRYKSTMYVEESTKISSSAKVADHGRIPREGSVFRVEFLCGKLPQTQVGGPDYETSQWLTTRDG